MIMKFLREHKISLISFVFTYCFVFAVYYFTSVVSRPNTLFLQMRRYIPCALSVALAVELWIKAGLSWKSLLPHGLVAVLWIVVYPFCYWLTFHDTLTFIDKHFDQAFGTYFFAFSVSLRLLLLKVFKGSDCYYFQYGFALLHTIALLIPILQIGYFFVYRYPITEAASMALIQTNPAEAKEYILLNFGYYGILLTIVFWIIIYLFLVKANRLNLFFYEKRMNIIERYSVILLAFIICSTSIYSISMFRNTGVIKSYMAAKDYFAKVSMFKRYHEKNYRELEVIPSKPIFAQPSTIIVVIGESASSYYMSAYSDTTNNNTPWLKQVKGNDNFIVFTHAYTSKCQTVPALERALSEKNQYNNKEFNQSLTIIDIAKKAGYETYWFSNQGYIGGADTPITMVAKTADHAQWLCEDKALNGKPQYDEDLLAYLKKVDPNKNNFIVLHFMGSHEDCINRYPQSFAKFSKPNEFNMALNYDDSLAYTDYVLKEIYQYASDNLNLQAMLYFSDHGGDPYRKRHPDKAGFKSLQIPLFIYVSDEYKDIHRNAVQIYKENRNKYFTNDMIYEVICDLLQIKSNHFIEENSLLNKKYQYTPEFLTTNLGEKKLIEDKEPRQDG